MSSELVAGLIGGGLALVSGLAAQAFAAWMTRRRRVRELAGRFLAAIKAGRYFADAIRAEGMRGQIDSVPSAVQAQSEVTAVGTELALIAPRRLRTYVRGAMNGTIATLSEHVSADERRWEGLRAALDEAVASYERQLERLS